GRSQNNTNSAVKKQTRAVEFSRNNRRPSTNPHPGALPQPRHLRLVPRVPPAPAGSLWGVSTLAPVRSARTIRLGVGGPARPRLPPCPSRSVQDPEYPLRRPLRTSSGSGRLAPEDLRIPATSQDCSRPPPAWRIDAGRGPRGAAVPGPDQLRASRSART